MHVILGMAGLRLDCAARGLIKTYEPACVFLPDSACAVEPLDAEPSIGPQSH